MEENVAVSQTPPRSLRESTRQGAEAIPRAAYIADYFLKTIAVWNAARISRHAFSSNTTWREDSGKKSERKA